MKSNLIICLIVGALCVFGMCQFSNAAPVTEKMYLQERLTRIQLQIQKLSREYKESETRLNEILKKEADQKKAMEEQKAKDKAPKEE